jgi:hypothetical protein
MTNVLGLESFCGLGGRVHLQIAWAKLRACANAASIACKKLWG